MIAAAVDVDRAEILDDRVAVRLDDRRAAARRIPRAWLRDLEQNAAHRVVDLLVVSILTLVAEPLQQRPEPDRAQEVGVAVGEPEGNDERDTGPLFAEPLTISNRPPTVVPDLADPAITNPLREMSALERLVADYAGTGVTLGPHPMALRRAALAVKGVTRAIDLARGENGARVRVAGSVIVRQRPGTAKGFVFLSLEDETGIANVIVTPGLFARRRLPLVTEPFLLVEGILQMQDGVVSVRATRVESLPSLAHVVPSHDFG